MLFTNINVEWYQDILIEWNKWYVGNTKTIVSQCNFKLPIR